MSPEDRKRSPEDESKSNTEENPESEEPDNPQESLQNLEFRLNLDEEEIHANSTQGFWALSPHGSETIAEFRQGPPLHQPSGDEQSDNDKKIHSEDDEKSKSSEQPEDESNNSEEHEARPLATQELDKKPAAKRKRSDKKPAAKKRHGKHNCKPDPPVKSSGQFLTAQDVARGITHESAIEVQDSSEEENPDTAAPPKIKRTAHGFQKENSANKFSPEKKKNIKKRTSKATGDSPTGKLPRKIKKKRLPTQPSTPTESARRNQMESKLNITGASIPTKLFSPPAVLVSPDPNKEHSVVAIHYNGEGGRSNRNYEYALNRFHIDNAFFERINMDIGDGNFDSAEPYARMSDNCFFVPSRSPSRCLTQLYAVPSQSTYPFYRIELEHPAQIKHIEFGSIRPRETGNQVWHTVNGSRPSLSIMFPQEAVEDDEEN